MANSTISVGDVASYAKTHPDISPVVQTSAGGLSLQPALTIASMVMTEMVAQAFNWKWNRFLLPVFYTNSFQQDYALNVVNLGWLEHGILVDINNTAIPKPQWTIEVVRQLESTSTQYGQPGQVCWLPNDQMYFGTWGAANTGNATRGNNPQALTAIQSPLSSATRTGNFITQVVDSFSNLWVITTYGTTGATNPFLSNLNPVFPTPTNPTLAATTATDGSVVWTAVNPKGQGIRCSPTPSQTGVIYQFYLVGQWRPFTFSGGFFTSFDQTIEPIPDDFAKYFFDGFVAMAYAHSPEGKLRAKAQDEKMNWLKSLGDSLKAGDRERENAGFYPANAILAPQYSLYPGPSWPFPLPGA